MRLTGWLVLGSLLVAPAVSAQDSFKKVEYITGTSMLLEKKKGTLIVSPTEVQLVNKKGDEVYLTIPMTIIRGALDSIFQASGLKGKLGNKIFGSTGPDQRLLIATQTDSSAETIIFKVHEENAAPNIAAKIRWRMGQVQKAMSSSTDSAKRESGTGTNP